VLRTDMKKRRTCIFLQKLPHFPVVCPSSWNNDNVQNVPSLPSVLFGSRVTSVYPTCKE
jgi:hypothetical protein